MGILRCVVGLLFVVTICPRLASAQSFTDAELSQMQLAAYELDAAGVLDGDDVYDADRAARILEGHGITSSVYAGAYGSALPSVPSAVDLGTLVGPGMCDHYRQAEHWLYSLEGILGGSAVLYAAGGTWASTLTYGSQFVPPFRYAAAGASLLGIVVDIRRRQLRQDMEVAGCN